MVPCEYGVWRHSWRSGSLAGKSAMPSLSPLSLQCNRLDLGMELLGLSVNNCGRGGGETAQLLVHSHQDISMWQLSQVSQLSQHLHPISTDPLTSCLREQLESHFASMFSNTVALSQVESPDETRIMATAEVIPISLIQHFLTFC